MKKYTPIACSLYDYFELLILKKQKVIVTTATAKIESAFANIYTKKGVEYLVLETGEELRLDTIEKINNLNTGEFIQCKS